MADQVPAPAWQGIRRETSLPPRSPVTSEPPALPIVGHLVPFLRDRLGFLTRCAAEYGPVVRLRVGEPTLFLSQPDDVRHVLASNAENYEKTPRLTSPRGRRISGDGVLTATGAAHMERRLAIQPAFQRSALEPLGEAVLDRVDRRIATWRDGARVDAAAEMMSITRDVLLAALFGKRFRDDGGRVAAAIEARRAHTACVFASLVPFRERIPTPVVLRFRAAMRHLDGVISAAIAERRRSTDEGASDFLGALVRARGPDGAPLPDRAVRDEALTLMTTGFETLGEGLSWTCHLLSRHPDADARLADEVRTVLGGRAPGAADIWRLPYAWMAVSESLRIFPPTWLFVRMATADDVLPSGARVAAGTKVYLCQYVSHRDPRHFPDPERFDPDRFSEAGLRRIPAGAYFPFGMGPHTCLGQAFARMVSVTTLARIAQRFRLEPATDAAPVPVPGITLTPRGGVPVVLRAR